MEHKGEDSTGAVDMGLIRAAMAFRVKYRVPQADGKTKRKLPLQVLGVHPMNRGGVYPSPDTVNNLGVSIVNDGCNPEEANHEGVCVQELPPKERKHDPMCHSKPYQTYTAYNRGKTKESMLSTCFDQHGDVLYGTLSHGHLLLTLLGWVTRATWKVPDSEKWKTLVDKDHRLDPDAVAAKDTCMADIFKEGLDMEILSWKMYKEEPTACSMISQALNKGQQLALKTTELTAVAVLTGAIGLEMEAKLAKEVAFETIREKVRGELDVFVDEPEFIEVFDCVISLGATKNNFVSDLLDFGSKFVDQKQRQLRMSAFAMVNKMPIEAPCSKVAVLKRAFRKTPAYGYCPSPEVGWQHFPKPSERREREREWERERERATE